MSPPIEIDGTDITGATIDGTEVQEITIDGQTVFTAVPPIPDSIVDNFESGNLNNWKGRTGEYDTTQTDVPEGSEALENTSGNNNRTIISEPSDGLSIYPSEGDIASCLIRLPSGGQSPALLTNCTQKSSTTFDGYSIWIRTDNEYRLMRHDDSPYSDTSTGRTTLGAGSIGGTVDIDTWYWLEVQMPTSSQDLEGSLFEFDVGSFEIGSQVGSSFSATDTNHASNRGVGAQFGLPEPNESFLDLIGIMDTSSA